MDDLSNLLLYFLLLVAVGAGFLLGRRERKPARPKQAVIKDYYQGLNFLLGERPDLGVERFIEAMEVSDETIDVHLAMASVVRRRGEVDKAIRIHQNMLAMPVLSGANKQLVELELARDYHQAGLLDRAESLLLQITGQKGAQHKPALELLLDLYEQEREWEKAIEVCAKLVRNQPRFRARLCHFYCELAEASLEVDLKVCEKHIKDAIAAEPSEPRSYWLYARLNMQAKHYKRVLKHIDRAVELKPELVAEYLDTYRIACENLTDDAAYEKFLVRSAQLHPDPLVLRALVGVRRRFGQPDTAQLTQEIARAPAFEHVPLLLDIADSDAETPIDPTIREQINRIVKQASRFQCENCGFTSQTLMWHCPTCKSWGSFS